MTILAISVFILVVLWAKVWTFNFSNKWEFLACFVVTFGYSFFILWSVSFNFF